MIEHLRHWLHRRGHPVRYADLERLLRNQALSREEVLRKQQRDLADIVAVAAGNTAYTRRSWRRTWTAGRWRWSNCPS